MPSQTKHSLLETAYVPSGESHSYSSTKYFVLYTHMCSPQLFFIHALAWNILPIVLCLTS